MQSGAEMVKRRWLSIVVVALLLVIAPITGTATTSVETVSSSAPIEEIIVCFKKNTGPSLQQAVTTKYNYTIVERNEALNCALVQVTREDTQRVVAGLVKEDIVKYIEPNKRVHALYTPNDPLYPSQWGPQHIMADWTWDNEPGNKDVTIAIVDSGIDYTHEDLSNNYVAGGYDWVNSDSDPMDDYGHGTHCAGIAAATLDNEKGIAGIAQVNLIAEKVLSETGWGTEWDLAQAIVHAADNNADIISLSLGGVEVPVAEEACLYAWNHGCLLVAASGNEHEDKVTYPAAYETVIAVGAINQINQRCGFSNWGPNLELVAPGFGILSSYPSNSYASLTGTSMAAPHVAGVAALIWSKYPFVTNHEVRAILTQTADDLGTAGFDQYYGYGKVNAFNATDLHIFDTNQSQNPYPSISGEHNGTIMLNQTIIISKLYTYPCPGTGGHTEYARIWASTLDVNATWNGYNGVGDYHYIEFNEPVILRGYETYNYTIRTGSYPQIHHKPALKTANGWINCTIFTDINGKTYPNWIPSIKLSL
jgi:thermitase